MQRYKLNISLLLFSTIGLTFACSEDTLDVDGEFAEKKGDNPGKGGFKPPKDGGGDAGIAGDGDGGGVTLCDGKVYACGDTLDNDGDGLADYQDPECTTPCDGDEHSFQTDLPGQNEDCKSDCYFDDNTGVGDDHCEQDLQCDPESPGALIGCEYDAELACAEMPAAQPDACLDACLPRVPNGCDCFGCCELGEQFVYLDGSPDCSVDNPAACQSCTFNDACANTCEPENCELCFGQTPDQLPLECQGEPACPDSVTSCTGHADCPANHFCQTGCCISFG